MKSGMLVAVAGAAFGVFSAYAGDDTRAYKAELAADAAGRTSALAAEAGETTVKVGGFMQFRYMLNFRDDPSASGFHDSGFTNGFEAPRTRINASGQVGGKDLTYKIEGDFAKSGGTFSLLDAYMNYAFDANSSLRFGQGKLSLIREENVSDTLQLAVNRSVANEIFTQKRSQFIQYGYKNENLQFRGAFSDGLNTLNTDYASTAEADWALTARVDFKGAGDWKAFDDFSSFRGSPNSWLAGVAAHYQSAGNTASNGSVDQSDLLVYTADFTYEGNGWNAYGAVIGRHSEPSTGDSLDDFGAVLQAGVFVNDNVEVFGRWDAVFPDGDRPGDDVFNTITAGANWYLFEKSQAAKFTADVAWYLQATSDNTLVASLAGSNNVALRPSTEENQFALRFQFQFIY